jgi:6,7-dimethyl-8-ribityllumazine synthase
MPNTIEGTLSATGLRFAIVASRFNGLIVEPLVAGALDAIVRSGGNADDVTIIRCRTSTTWRAKRPVASRVLQQRQRFP